MTKLLPALAFAALMGCSGGFESAEMQVSYRPPHGVRLVEEQPGPPRVARFTSGLEIRSVAAPPPAIAEGKLEALLSKVSPETRGDIINAREGSLPAGRVVRWSLKDGEERALVYFLPRADRYLVLQLRASEARFASLESQLELSLSTLKVRDR